jgi:hypothetical protein
MDLFTRIRILQTHSTYYKLLNKFHVEDLLEL